MRLDVIVKASHRPAYHLIGRLCCNQSAGQFDCCWHTLVAHEWVGMHNRLAGGMPGCDFRLICYIRILGPRKGCSSRLLYLCHVVKKRLAHIAHGMTHRAYTDGGGIRLGMPGCAFECVWNLDLQARDGFPLDTLHKAAACFLLLLHNPLLTSSSIRSPSSSSESPHSCHLSHRLR